MDFFISCSAFSIKIHCSKQGKCTEQIALDTCFYLASEQLNDTAFDLPAECCDRSQVALVFIYKTPTHTEYILQSKIFCIAEIAHSERLPF